MRGSICAILFLLPFFHDTSYAQSYGLRFSSHEVVQEKRTSLNLSPTEDLCFSHDAEISFDLLFAQDMEIYFGYIFRVITADGQNIDLIYNQKYSNFNFIIGDAVSGTFTIDSTRLYNDWSRFAIRLNATSHEVAFYVNGKFAGKSSAHIKPGMCFKMSFGTNSFDDFQTEDIPPMSLKDIRISENGKIKYYWPLSETSGNECFDSVQRRVAKVNNPVWIKPQHQNWKLAGSFGVNGSPSLAFDAAREELYIVSTDSLYTLSLSGGQMTGNKWADGKEVLPAGNQSVFDPISHRLYNFYIDQKKVRSYDTNTRRWDGGFSYGPMTEFSQADKFLSKADTSLYIMGGYGQLTYKNSVQRYDLADRKWETVKTGGDYFTPRYLFAVGMNAAGDTAFVLGGYGSISGNQMANPKYLYDLLAYSVRSRSFKALYHLKEPDKPFCFASSLVIDSASSQYYALIYSNDKFNSALQLISGSLRSPGYQLLGDEIPYSFYDIKSFADLYYCPLSKQLVAVTLYTDKEDKTDVKVYTIAFPPNAIVTVSPPSNKSFRWVYLLLVPLLGLVLVVVYGRRRSAARRLAAGQAAANANTANAANTNTANANTANAGAANEANTNTANANTANANTANAGAANAANPNAANSTTATTANSNTANAGAANAGSPNVTNTPGLTPRAPAHAVREEPPPPDGRSKIFFFGQFEVYDAAGNDLTKQFTPLLKEMFLLIGIYTLRSGKGISSEKLYSILWRDKSNKDAQNNRSVNMVKLKGILDKLGTCGIVKEADKWIFHYAADQIRMDLADFLALLHIVQPDKQEIHQLLAIIHRGAFLADTTYHWLDDIQSEMSDKALDVLSAAILRFSNDAEFLLEIAGGIFLFDPVNEEALKVKCKSLGILGRHSMAKATFEKFAKEYHQMYGEEFQQTFHEVIN